MTLGAKIIDFIGLDRAQNPVQGTGVIQIAVDQVESPMGHMWIFIDGIDATCIERTGTTHNAVNFVASPKQKFGQIGPILSGNPCNQCFPHAKTLLEEERIIASSVRLPTHLYNKDR